MRNQLPSPNVKTLCNFKPQIWLEIATSSAAKIICGPRVAARGLEPPEGHLGKRDLLEASEWPTFFSRSVENGHPSPRPLKSRPGAPESGALRGFWQAVSQTPKC